jgi:hypothetical protein
MPSCTDLRELFLSELQARHERERRRWGGGELGWTRREPLAESVPVAQHDRGSQSSTEELAVVDHDQRVSGP